MPSLDRREGGEAVFRSVEPVHHVRRGTRCHRGSGGIPVAGVGRADPAVPAGDGRARGAGVGRGDGERGPVPPLGPVGPLDRRDPRLGLRNPRHRTQFRPRPAPQLPAGTAVTGPAVCRLSGQFLALLARFRSQNSFVSWACRVPACRVRRVGRAVRGCVGRCVRGVRPHVASRGPRRRRRVAFRCRVFRAGVARIWWW